MTKNKLYIYVLAAVVVCGFFCLLAFLVLKPIPEINRDMLNLAVGALLGSFSTVIGYFFGSSAGSQEKTNIIAKSQPVEIS